MKSLSLTVCVAAFISSTAGLGETKETSSGKMICKKFVDTGSLVKGRKICKTSSQWEKERQRAQQTGRDLQTGGSRISGPGS